MGVVDAYERLRAAVLSAELISGAELAILRRQGIAAWIRASRSMPATPTTNFALQPRVTTAPATNELTRILASLVVTLAKESDHV